MKYVYGACITNDENTVLFLGYAQSLRSGYVTQGLTLCHSVTTYNFRTFQEWNLVTIGFTWTSWKKDWGLLWYMNHELSTSNPQKNLTRINHTKDTKFCVKLKSAYHTQIACKLCTIIALFTCSSLVFRLLNIHVRVLVVENLKCVYAFCKHHAQLRTIYVSIAWL